MLTSWQCLVMRVNLSTETKPSEFPQMSNARDTQESQVLIFREWGCEEPLLKRWREALRGNGPASERGGTSPCNSRSSCFQDCKLHGSGAPACRPEIQGKVRVELEVAMNCIDYTCMVEQTQVGMHLFRSCNVRSHESSSPQLLSCVKAGLSPHARSPRRRAEGPANSASLSCACSGTGL